MPTTQRKTRRVKPAFVRDDIWAEFVNWCDNNGVGRQLDDWMPWFNCWSDGFALAIKLKENVNAKDKRD
jgi:hypothetical protein